jgi:hypothetical protein
VNPLLMTSYRIEIMEVVKNFQFEEIRQRVNEIYDDVTQSLVECGQTCLDKLTAMVMGEFVTNAFFNC